MSGITSRSSRSEVLEAVKQDGVALACASAALKGDREIVLEAVKQNWNALKYASAALKDDREIVLEAVNRNGRALEYASARLQKLGKRALLKGDKAMDDPFIVVGGAKSNQIHSMEE